MVLNYEAFPLIPNLVLDFYYGTQDSNYRRLFEAPTVELYIILA